MAATVATLVQWFAPWQSAYSDSKALDSAVTGIHLVALLFGGGLAVAADRAMLRALRAGPSARALALDALQATHRPVLVALAISFLSGIALATADVNTFAHSPVFLVKLSLVALLCGNGLVLVVTERALREQEPADAAAPLWRRLRAATWLSITLWTSVVVAGTTLVNAG